MEPIESNINLGWVATSMLLNIWNLDIGTFVDLGTGALYRIKTDSIYYNLVELEDKPNDAIESEITNPTMQIRTKNTTYLIKPKTLVSVKLNNYRNITGVVESINSNSFTIKQNNYNVKYSDISKITIYQTRRWYPILTMPTIIPPIIWAASAKTLEYNSNNCKKNIIAIKTIDFTKTRVYGKNNCN